MKKIQLEIILTLQGPILTHTESSKGFGFDMVSRTYDNLPVINGSQIRGNLLHCLKYFNQRLKENSPKLELPIDEWFGKDSEKDKFIPLRGNLIFDYFWKCDQSANAKRRFRIGINDQTGTVEPGNLQVIQAAFETGQKAKFSGRVQAWVNDNEQQENLTNWLDKALQYLSSIGALKGVGYGKLIDYQINEITEDSQACSNCVIHAPEDGKAFELELDLKLDRPFCIARPHLPDSNRFVSENHITGSALKGALAQQWKLSHDKFLENSVLFTSMRFTHAQPCRADAPRGLPIPLSLVLVDDQLIDAALHPACFILQKTDGEDIQQLAPAFATDWKPKQFEYAEKKLLALKYPLFSDTNRILTVHTAIEAESNASEKGKLFSLECIDPASGENEMIWKTQINIHEFSQNDKDVIDKLLQEITQNGINGIGKTKANARIVGVRDVKIGSTQPELSPIDDCFVLMLSSKARLLPANHKIPATGGNQHLQQLYQEYFEYVSNDSLTLSHFYAQQSLYGGEFYWRYYRKKNPDYQPEWLTVPGSVFVLKVIEGKEKEAHGKLNSWCESGLPSAKDRTADNWRTDPLIAQNGYGEIVVNHPVHNQLHQPKAGEVFYFEDEVANDE